MTPTKGYLKIADFGFSIIQGQSDSSNIVFGTLEYLAPEIVFGKDYTQNSLLWTLGVLIFEMVTGFPPFRGEKSAVFASIVKGFTGFTFPPYFPNLAEEVVRMLCRLKPQQRPELSVLVRLYFLSF